MSRLFLLLASLSGLLGVVFGAFGVHGLKQRITPEMLVVYQTGVQYQFCHVLALFVCGMLLLQGWQHPALRVAGWMFVIGMVLFSGSLYLLAITGQRWLGAITPMGGGAFIAGWCALAVAIWRHKV